MSPGRYWIRLRRCLTARVRVLSHVSVGTEAVVLHYNEKPMHWFKYAAGGETIVDFHTLRAIEPAGKDPARLDDVMRPPWAGPWPGRAPAQRSGTGGEQRRLEWLGGAPVLAALFPEASMPLSEVVRHVHPQDRRALRRLVRSTAARSPWVRLRFLTEGGGWHHLICRTRRLILGSGGPERVFGVIRDDTKREVRRRRTLTALSGERQRADEIAAFSSAVMTAATEQEIQQVVPARRDLRRHRRRSGLQHRRPPARLLRCRDPDTGGGPPRPPAGRPQRAAPRDPHG